MRRLTTAFRQVQRFQREDREDARHQVEQQPAEDRPEDREQDRQRAQIADQPAAMRNAPRRCLELQPAPVAKRDYAREFGWLATLADEFRDDRIAVPPKLLRSGIINRAVGDRIEVGPTDRDVARQRNCDPKLLPGQFEPRPGPSGSGRARATIEPAPRGCRTRRHIERETALSGTNLVGAGSSGQLRRLGLSLEIRREFETHSTA